MLYISKNFAFSNIYYPLLSKVRLVGVMPVQGYKNFTIKREAAQKLEKYASANGLKLVQLVDKLAEKVEIDIPLMYLLKSIENSRFFILKEVVEAEYLRDLLVKLFLNMRNIYIELQTLLHPNVDLGSLSPMKSHITSIVNAIKYQTERLEKILDEAYPRGWAAPLPPPPASYAFLQPHYFAQKRTRQEWIIKEQLYSFLKTIQSQVLDTIKILDKIKPHLPEISESIGEALSQINLKLEEIYAKYR